MNQQDIALHVLAGSATSSDFGALRTAIGEFKKRKGDVNAIAPGKTMNALHLVVKAEGKGSLTQLLISETNPDPKTLTADGGTLLHSFASGLAIDNKVVDETLKWLTEDLGMSVLTKDTQGR